MAIQLITPAAAVEFTYSGDTGKTPTKFQARGLRSGEMALLGDLVRVNADGTLATNRRQKAVLAFRMGITGWTGLDLKPEWEEGLGGRLLKEAQVDQFPFEVVLEIGEKIIQAQALDQEDRGN